MIVFIFIGLFLGSFSSVKVMMAEFMPFTWDVIFADIDKAIHFGDPWRYLTALDKYHDIITLLYSGVWMVLHVALTLFICVSDFKIRAQYLYTFVTTWIICGNIIPLMFMAVGPIYFERLTGSPRFAELSDRIFGTANEMTPQGRVADMLWQSYIDKDPFIGSGISAFPSMHVAISMLMFLTASRFSKGLGALGFGFLVFTVVGSVNLAWHYAIDGYASIILVTLIWMFWGRVFQADNYATDRKAFSERPENGLVPAE